MVLLLKRHNLHARRALTLIVLLCFLSIVQNLSFAQATITLTKNDADDVVKLRQDLLKSTQFVVDTTLKGLRNHIEALSASTSRAVHSGGKRLTVLVDSLIVSAQDSLDAARQDSLRALNTMFIAKLAPHESSTRQLLDARLSAFTGHLLKARKSFADCPDCEDRSDFFERLADFRDFTDSLVSEFHETASSLMEERSDLFADAFDAARDSLHDMRDGLIDNRLGDIEMWRYGVSRLVFSSAYASHSAYRGRDIGLVQQSISPSVTYRHSSGLNIQASTYWLNNAGNRWDNFQLTGGYEFRLSGVLGGSLSYTHFWFNDSSTSELSVFTDNAQAGFSFDWPAISIAALGSMNFGTATEFTLTTSISHNFEIPFSLYNKITVSPSFSWVLGQQNSELTSLLTTKGKGKKAAVTTSAQKSATSTFGVLDYEVSLPATIELGPVTLVPSATYIIPLNVVDASTRTSFINLEFGIFLTIR